MSRSRNWQSYAEAFHDLLRTAAIQEIIVPVADVKAAQSLRGKLYGLIGALKYAVKAKDCPEEAKELFRVSSKVKLNISENPPALVAIPRDLDPLAQSVASALRVQTSTPLAADEYQPSAELEALARGSQPKPDPE